MSAVVLVVFAVFFIVAMLRILGMPVYAAREIRGDRPTLGWAMIWVWLFILWIIWDVGSSFMH
jgi:hypothetical protein